MISKEMLALGKKSSVIREIFEYAKVRRGEIGAENVFDFSLGNPSIPAPSVVGETMQKLIAEAAGKAELAPLALGEYELKEEYDITKRYEVTDANSKQTFDVYFYFYGDILSGWNVYLKK